MSEDAKPAKPTRDNGLTTWKDRLVIVTCMSVLGFLIAIFWIGASQKRYTVTTENYEGRVYHVFRSSNGSIFVEKVE